MEEKFFVKLWATFKVVTFEPVKTRQVCKICEAKINNIIMYASSRVSTIKAFCKCMTRGGVLLHMGHIGMCRCEGYGFQAVYSSIGYINQSVWV